MTAHLLLPFQSFMLQQRLSSLPSSASANQTILLRLWAPEVTAQNYDVLVKSPEAYMQHIYCDLCRIACAGSTQDFASYTHEELLGVCEDLRRPGWTFNDCLAKLGPPTAEKERLIRLAASLLVPLNISGVGGVRAGKSVNWEQDQSLADLIVANIKLPRPPTHAPQAGCTVCNSALVPVHLPTNLNAHNLEYLAGFEIIWTNVIIDHLKILEVDDKIKVYLYHQTSLLERHRSLPDPIIPQDYILEIFETLALLVPKRDPDVQKWFHKLQIKYNLDPGAGACAHLPNEYRYLNHFRYFKDRLKDLKEVFESREPSGPVYVWRDRSKPVQWWTFWIAVLVLILTLVFGLIQSITGILQVTGLSSYHH